MISLPKLHPLVRWWMKRHEWDRDPTPFSGNWGLNHKTYQWHMGSEQGRLPALPTSPMASWPRRFRLALDEMARDFDTMLMLEDDARQEKLLDKIGKQR